MRLTAAQQQQIQHIVREHLGATARVAVFGSRTDDDKKGGDVDLYLETPQHVTLNQRAALKLALEQALSLPVDIVSREAGKQPTPFQAIAKAGAQQLSTHTP